MSTALEAASLIMIPNSYSDGLLASVKPNDGTGDFTFTRGSNLAATRVKADGYIEKGYENLLLQSNQFDTTWASVRVSESTGFAGYDGTNNAWKIVPNTQLNDHRLDQSTSVSGVWTFSIYAKAAGYNFLYILFSGIGNSGKVIDISPNQGVVVDNKGGVQAIDESITDVGNDWWKITLTYSGTLGTLRIITLPANDTSSYAGDGTSGILIQDAMLNQGLAALPYVESVATKGKAGVLENTPRIDFTGGTPSLLLEPSRANVITQSEYLNGVSWVGQVDITFTPNYGISPEGVKNSTRIQFADSSAYAYIQANITTNAVASVYVKGPGGETFRFGLANNAASGGLLHTFSGEWERISNTRGTNGQLIISSYGGTALDFEAYGLQLEQNATYETSYIPTYGVSQTRAAEVINSNISSLGVADEFTLFIDTNGALVSGTSLNAMDDLRWYTQSTNYYRFYKTSDALFISYNIQVNDRTKIALKITETECKTFVDGVLDSTISLATPFASFNSLARNTENKLKDNLNQLLVFPTALTDSECIELTTV